MAVGSTSFGGTHPALFCQALVLFETILLILGKFDFDLLNSRKLDHPKVDLP